MSEAVLRRVAFITAARWRELCDDDRLAAEALRRRGVEVVPVVWDETPAAALERFDAVVMRSPWDWYRRTTEFRAWLETLRGARARLFNEPEVLCRFADKTYFEGLQARGLPVVPTTWLTVAELPALAGLVARHVGGEAVLKPAFSANAFRTFRFRPGGEAPAVAELSALPPPTRLMLQPYYPEIETGEWSLVFFDGVHSHTVLKRPKAGDFRVQAEHGGGSQPAVAPPGLVQQAAALLEAAAPGTLYARVDGVERGGRLFAMELELVEPELFFRHDPGASERFADALLRRLDATRAPS